MNLNERIKNLREEKRLTQKEIAEKIGVSERVYSYYEKDRFPKDEIILKNIATALGTTVAALIGEDAYKEDKFVALARSAEKLSDDEQDKLFQIFESTMDVFLKNKK